MWDSSEGLELVLQASKAQQEGDISKAFELIDQAISLAERANSTEHMIQWKVSRALLVMDSSGDLSVLIAASQEALRFYTQEKNTLKQLEALINLAGLMAKVGDRAQALSYLDDADNLISSLSSADLVQITRWLEGSAVSAEFFLYFKRADIARIRKYLSENLS
jgi:tetratricopeptide (TPR) repeat protein